MKELALAHKEEKAKAKQDKAKQEEKNVERKAYLRDRNSDMPDD